ncbi:MAG: NADP-dependent malic enzyme [Marinilabiliales bacterium]|nr:NADP-dependent malic enzyme [Marinilabiliales bacterium]
MAKLNQDALDYHSNGKPGKISVVPTKPHATQRDLGLAYSPGVASPCLAIKDNPDDIYKYTAKGNLVAVISNGTAVLGLGNIGAGAGKPVMEGKGLLFKIYADIDVFDIELDTMDTEKFIDAVKIMAPTFGGINLEDIKAPECFEIEERLKKELDIPIMHDDQHGTAIISSAGLLNAVELAGKKIGDVRIVVNGAGASAVSCTKLYIAMGAKRENVLMCDSRGVLHHERTDLNSSKMEFVRNTPFRTLKDAIVGADVFIGLSVAGVLTQEMVRSMAPNPIVFALANPDPEIPYEEAKASRPDLIFATGRSDYPNQINNVLGFPFIFRGALDVRAKAINEEMKIACVKALSALAKEKVPEAVLTAYNTTKMIYGRDYFIPKPMDPRLITRVAPAVAKAAIESGVARHTITDWDAYTEELGRRLGSENKLISMIVDKAKQEPKKVALPDASDYEVLKAANIAYQEKIAIPVLIGNEEKIKKLIEEFELDFGDVQIIDNRSRANDKLRRKYAEVLFEKRKRKGMTLEEAVDKMFDKNYFAALMLECGDVDAVVSGYSTRYAEAIMPALEVTGKKPDVTKIFGMHLIISPKGTYFLADTTIDSAPDVNNLVDTAVQASKLVRLFDIEPIVGMLSYSNFGSNHEASPNKVREAVKILHRDYPEMIVDGEMQLSVAVDKKIRKQMYPFNKLADKDCNVLIFPNLSSANIATHALQHIAGAETLGPILVGNKKSIQVMQMHCSVRDVVNMISIAVVDAQLS